MWLMDAEKVWKNWLTPWKVAIYEGELCFSIPFGIGWSIFRRTHIIDVNLQDEFSWHCFLPNGVFLGWKWNCELTLRNRRVTEESHQKVIYLVCSMFWPMVFKTTVVGQAPVRSDARETCSCSFGWCRGHFLEGHHLEHRHTVRLWGTSMNL